MANDTHCINIMLDVISPSYVIRSAQDWNEHYHKNDELKQAITDAVKELIENTLSSVMVDGVEMELSSPVVQYDGVEVEPNLVEQVLLENEAKTEQEAWDQFHAELERRTEQYENEHSELRGVYSMGDLSGPISQLDIVVHDGGARVVINDGWDDDEPVYSSVTKDPTNWDMFVMFSEALKQSADQHHVYFEGIRYIGTDDEGVSTFEARTGS